MSIKFKYDQRSHQESRNFLLFTISLFATIILPGIITTFSESVWVFNALYGTTILIGTYTVTTGSKGLFGGLMLGFIALGLFAINFAVGDWFIALEVMEFLFACSFFGFIFYKCIVQIISSNHTDLQTLFAAVSGYLTLGIIATLIFSFINTVFPEAFDIEATKSNYELVYFSFVTLTTIGYGDITPQIPIAESLAIFFGIVGQLYLTILVAFLVGKYVSTH